MAIVKMKHLQVLALERDHDAILRRLQHMGCLEISEPDVQAFPDTLRRCDTAAADLLARQRQLQSAIDILRRTAPPQKTGLLTPRPRISEREYLDEAALASELETAQHINEMAADVNRLTARETQLRSEQAALTPWRSLDIPLELTETRWCDITTGTLPPFAVWDEIQGALSQQVPESEVYLLYADRQQQGILLLTHKAVTAQALELLRSFGFSGGQLKGRHGTPEENLTALADSLRQTAAEKDAALQELAGLGGKFPDMQLCSDRLNSRLMREENRKRLMTDGCIVAFDGWVPAEKLPQLTAWLDTLDCAYDLSDPTPEEIPDVPVALKGNILTRSMNCITEQYSMPAYDGVDPNPVMAPFFIFFFGMMMADMGYGLLMIVGSLLFLKKKRPDDRSFMEMIFWCGIMTFIFGALTGGFFGDFIPQLCKLIDPASTFTMPALFDPLNDTMAIMVGSLVLGGIQVFTGMTVSVVEKCRNGHFPDALFDEITWWIILAGGAMAILGSVGGVPVVLCVGGLMLLYGAGRGKKGFGKVTGVVAAVYNGVTGFFSDILSYVRLMALMLSGAVLAQVFNMLGATTGNIVLFVIIAIRVATLPGAAAGYEYLLVPRWEALLNPTTWVYALGQAFFSLSLAGCGTLVYGSYLKRDVDVVDAAKNVAIFDTIAGLVAACVVVPAVFAFGLDVSSGPPLLFITLAQVFQEMPFGNIFAVILFAAVVFAAITSLLNLFEAPVEALQAQLGLSRAVSVGIVAVIAVAVGLFLENGSSVSDWMDVISIYVIPVGAFLAAVMFFWVCPRGFAKKQAEAGRKKPLGRWFNFMTRYVFVIITALVIVLGIFYGGIG